MKSLINKYVSNIIKKIGVNEEDKIKIASEIEGHLEESKMLYLEKSFSNKESEQKAIEDFEYSQIVNELRDTYIYNNKQSKFYIKDYVKGILIFGVLYYILLYFILEITPWINVFLFRNLNIFAFLISYLLLYFYIKMKLKAYNDKEEIKILLIIGVVFLFEVALVDSLLILARNSKFVLIFNYKLLVAMLICIMLFTTISYFADKKNLFSNLNLFNLDLSEFLFLFFAIFLNVLYFLTPNRYYLMHQIFENLKLNMTQKNIFIINTNENIIIPNIGLFMLIFFIFNKLNKKNRG